MLYDHERLMRGKDSLRIVALLRRQGKGERYVPARYQVGRMWLTLAEVYQAHWRKHMKLRHEAAKAVACLETLLYAEPDVRQIRIARATAIRLKRSLE